MREARVRVRPWIIPATLLGCAAVFFCVFALPEWLWFAGKREAWRAARAVHPPSAARTAPTAPTPEPPALWYHRVLEGLGCYRLPDLRLTATFPEDAVSRWAETFAGDLQGRRAVLFGDQGGVVVEPCWSLNPVASIPGALTGAFSPSGRHLAYWAQGKLAVCSLPEGLALEAPATALRPMATADAPRPGRLMWPMGTKCILAVGMQGAQRPTGCRAYRFAGGRLTTLWERPACIAAAAGVDGHVLVVSLGATAAEAPVVEWVAGDGGGALRLPATVPRDVLDVAVAGDLVLWTRAAPESDHAGQGCELTGWDRTSGQTRFALWVATYVNLWPQELLRGYAVAEVSYGGFPQHHPEVVTMDCTGPWPQVVAVGPCGFLPPALQWPEG